MSVIDQVSNPVKPRLIPAIADRRPENRATSIFLSVLEQVPAFRWNMMKSIGQRPGKRTRVRCLTEVIFENSENRPSGSLRPDGLIEMATGKTTWSALLEVKVDQSLNAQQITDYAQLAKDRGVDAIITLSNQLTTTPDAHPLRIGKGARCNRELYHWSWQFVLTQAKLTMDLQDIPESDRFILDEMVNYLSHRSSGIKKFNSMGKSWKELVAKVRKDVVLRKNDSDVQAVVRDWIEEEKDLSLQLSRENTRTVTLQLSRLEKSDPTARYEAVLQQLLKHHSFRTVFISDAGVPNVTIEARMRERQIVCSIELDAPTSKKRFATRANWLKSQLVGVESDLDITAIWPSKIVDTRCTLESLRKNVFNLAEGVQNESPKRFRLKLSIDLAQMFNRPSKFVDRLEEVANHFFTDVALRVKPVNETNKRKKPVSKRIEQQAIDDPISVGESSNVVIDFKQPNASKNPEPSDEESLSSDSNESDDTDETLDDLKKAS